MNPIDISAKPGTLEHVHVGKNCSAEESEAYMALFKEFHDIFFWSYEEMSEIDLLPPKLYLEVFYQVSLVNRTRITCSDFKRPL